ETRSLNLTASFRTSSGEHPESIISALFNFSLSPKCYQARSVDSESRSFLTVQNDEYRSFPEARIQNASLTEYGRLKTSFQRAKRD
ncbi:hypothetical protein, partial [Vibrio alfacsensis]|uniref:hypothetical protein n=1 Tax=Vibrio alfacsensis TaxID=1074311 RepID=UPI00406812DE